MLDEATSALDNLTERIVIQNVVRQSNHAAVIVIAHRLAAIRSFDKIIVFQNGTVADSGTFRELLKNNCYFRELYQKEQ
ncbi:MAG: hypothetical protein NC347_13780 [Clostridium sp.]|nr:hypothetical protein [Clostridium sp.]